ncbi:MAG: leucyl/phenylalanyl-tRNA--protein transferase [Planctomycetaceae bacterium]|nr:MAG: leucyl/phenylalanyl-tRNA--protein transferase [Planctomycetaceae bacterium]
MPAPQPADRELPWLQPGDPFPPTSSAWGSNERAPGLLAAGGALDVETLIRAYRTAVFPWFSSGQPILWWSPDPRMVLLTREFRLHRSLRKTTQRFVDDLACEIRVDTAFARTIQACAAISRPGQSGTWIVPDMVDAYQNLHAAGFAHSIETWVRGELVGGLYCVAIGKAVFGESMFTLRPDASKIALAALVAFCRQNGIDMIDCQQNTRHLASLGAREMPRENLLKHVQNVADLAPPAWHFDVSWWDKLVTPEQVDA